jgi:DNA-binding NtrC family response regulator
MIRQIDRSFPVVVISSHNERQWLETAMNLTAFSVMTKPLAFEPLLRQIQRIMVRLDHMLRHGRPGYRPPRPGPGQ